MAVCLTALVGAGATQAADQPWVGGPDVHTPLEQKLAQAGIAWIGSDMPTPAIEFDYVCLSPEEWAAVNDGETWGFVADEVDPHAAWLSPRTCTALQRLLLGRNGAKMCASGSRPIFAKEPRYKTVWRWVNKVEHVKQGSKWVWKTTRVRVRKFKRVEVTVRQGTEVLYERPCPDYTSDVLEGVQTVSVMSQYMWGGVDSTAEAECYGLQNIRWFVFQLVGDDAFAKEANLDYLAYYNGSVIQDPVYGSPECRQGGSLDLTPNDAWPWSD